MAGRLGGPVLDKTYDEAAPYCDTLDLGGYDDWRLPTVAEFRSLIVGCEATMIGKACNAGPNCGADAQTCLESCGDCDLMGGPASDGMYLDEMFALNRHYATSWTASVTPYSDGMVFTVDFRNASVGESATMRKFNIRCVRN